MNWNHIRKEPALTAAAAGFLGLMLRAALYRIGFDSKGILSASHPLHLACLVLTAIVAVYLALNVPKLPAIPEAHPRLRLLTGLGAGCFLLLHALFRQSAAAEALYRMFAGSQPLHHRISAAIPLIPFILTLIAAVSMTVCALPPEKKRPQAANCHGLVCMGFAADMLGRYRDWSGNPQLPDYVFHVLAGVTLSLTAYQTLALHTGLGKPKWQKFWALSALFLCLMCLSGPAPREFYFSGALWAAFCLLTAIPPEQEEAQEEENHVLA